MAALFDQLAGAQFAAPIAGKTGWATISRRIRLWGDVARADQPALFIVDHSETNAYGADNLLAKATMNVELFVYVATGRDPTAIPARDLNVALDAIFNVLAPTPENARQTLGGLVHSCRIEGRIVKDPGDLDGQGLLITPLKILCP